MAEPEPTMDDDLWTEWRGSYGGDGAKLVRDGIGDLCAWYQAPRRLLFVLREPNGHEGADARHMLRTGVAHQVWHRVAEWAAGLLHGFPPLDTITRAHLDATLRSIAVMNVKKLPGGASSSSRDIARAASRDRELLRRQMRLIEPRVVICCGTYGPVRSILADDLAIERLAPVRYSRLWNEGIVLDWRHPSRAGKLAAHEGLRRLWAQVAL